VNGSVFKRCPCTEKVRQSCKMEQAGAAERSPRISNGEVSL
jgi:hypothetical protein